MKSTKYRSANGRAIIMVVLVALSTLQLVGCVNLRIPRVKWPHRRTKISKEFEVVPTSNRDVADLSADDIVLIMRQAGFSDEQILELGPAVRNGLFLSGAVQIRRKDLIEVIFAINGNYVFITTRLRGSFIYDLKAGKFGFGTVPPESR